MRMRTCAIWAGTASLMFFGYAADADMVTIGASKDNTLYESDIGDRSNGAGDHFFVGMTALSDLRRGLLSFDIAAAVPAGATINSVTLTLNMSKTITGDALVSLHRSLADWGEGASHAPGEEGAGAPAAPGDATWDHTFFATDFWTNDGGDFDAGISASQTVGGLGQYSWTSATMASDVQSWLDTPAGNFGWFVIGDEFAVSAKRFDTRENSNAANQPSLMIDFTPVPGPGGVAFLGLGVLGLSRRRRKS